MQYSTSALAVLGFTAVSSAHIIMTNPVPYGKTSLNNSPLAADGSDYPCKLRGTTFEMQNPANVLSIGGTHSVAFQGTAVHGGGSCQLSIAMLPSGKTLSTLSDSDAKSLSFKVIHSIEGGCPMKNITGNNGDSASQADPDTYTYTIPSSVPTGNATFAWTWFNKIGNREMYMNCAPVTITSSSSKRDDASLESRDTSAFSALPDLFTANIGNGCTSQDSMDLIFPDPGDSLVMLGLQTSSALARPTGSCQAVVSATGIPSTAAVSATGVSPTGIIVAPSAATTAAATAATSAGGVFVTTPVASAAPTQTTASPVAASTASAVPSAAATGSSTTGSGSAIAAGTACTDEGMFNCISGTSYQQCASGAWSVSMPLAAGTQCTAGQSMSMIIASASKRSLKHFPREYIQRHIQPLI